MIRSHISYWKSKNQRSLEITYKTFRESMITLINTITNYIFKNQMKGINKQNDESNKQVIHDDQEIYKWG